jgi:AcrR family transcriptional regulator
MTDTLPEKRLGRPRDEGLTSRRQEEILQAAARHFAQKGFAETDVDSIAADLQIGKGTIYRYFPSKQELLIAVVERGMAGLQEDMDRCLAEFTDPLALIEAAIHRFLAYFERHPELVELFIQERAVFQERRKPTYFAAHETKSGPWRAMYEQLVAAGRCRPIPLALDQDVVNDLMFGTILANYFTGRNVSFETQARGIIDIVFNGLLTDAERVRRATAQNA